MIRHLSAVCLAAGIVCVPGAAFAQSSSGLALGLRLGYAIPMGKAGALAAPGTTPDTKNDNLHDTISGMVPLWFDVGYRIDPALYVGAFFQYGFAFVNKDNPSNVACNQGVSCSAHDITFGANVHYHILPDGSFDPWLGAGLGYEMATFSESGTVTEGTTSFNVDGSATFKGFEFLILEAGGDFKPAPNFAVGPFVNFALGELTTWSSSVTVAGVSQDQSGDLVDTGLHEWLTLGVRGQFSL